MIMIPEQKKQEIVKIIRAIAFSFAVVAFCMLYRDGKMAAKKKQEYDTYVKDFSEYLLHTAAQEAEAEMSQMPYLEKTYMGYDSIDLSRVIEIMSADSAEYANALVQGADVILNFHDKDMGIVLTGIKKSSWDKNLKHNADTNAIRNMANYYEQYKQYIKTLAASRSALDKKE